MMRWALIVLVGLWSAAAAAEPSPRWRLNVNPGFGSDVSDRVTPPRLRLAQAGEEEADPEEPKKPAEAKPGEEPAKPGETAKPGEEPSKPGATAKPADEPAKPAATKVGEPAPTPATEAAAKKSDVSYGIGLHVRGIFVPTWFLNLFLQASTPLNSMGFGAEFIRRKGNFDLVASVDYGFYSPRDGNYLGKNKNPAVDTDYLQFKNLSVLGFNVHFLWHHYFLKWFSLVYGAGVGLGVVLGNIYRVSNDPDRCNQNTFRDANACYPKGMDPARREEWLSDPKNQGTSDSDSPNSPKVYKETGKWPVIPIVHLLIGVNFKISEQFSVRVDGGWRDAFYAAATGQYFF